MLSNKFIRVLVVANGVLFLIIALSALIFIVSNLIRDFSKSNYNGLTGVIVGEDLDKAKQQNLALQGLSYDSPRKIYNSSNFLLPISAKTYENPKELPLKSQHIEKYSSFGIDDNLDSYTYTHGYQGFNIMFLDNNYNFLSFLLDKKAFIVDIDIPKRYDQTELIDTTVNHIAYKIVFEDTNKDRKLDYDDEQGLYISDLSGKNLTQVTENIDIERYNFQNDHKEIFIEYYERGDDSEYKRKKFLIYDIATKTYRKLESLEKALDEIEAQLVN